MLYPHSYDASHRMVLFDNEVLIITIVATHRENNKESKRYSKELGCVECRCSTDLMLVNGHT